MAENKFIKPTTYNKRAADIMGVNPEDTVGLISSQNDLASEFDNFMQTVEQDASVWNAREEVKGKEAAIRNIDKEAADTTARTEKQVMVENIVAGLGQVIAGYVAGKEGYDPGEMNIKTSNFGELLSGRLKQLDMKKATAADEVTRAERGLREKLDAAASWKKFQMQDTAEKNRMLAEASMRLYLENMENQRRKEAEATKDSEATLGSIAALTQSMNKQVTDIQGQRKSVRTLVGDLANADSAKVTAAKRELASMMDADPTTFEGLDNEAISARAGEYMQKISSREQALNKFSEKLAAKTASKKPFSPEEKEVISSINTGLVPTEGAPMGKVELSPAATKKFSIMLKAAQADDSLGKAVTDFIKRRGDTSLFMSDPDAIDVIQKIESKGVDSLTRDDLAKLDNVKDVDLLTELSKEPVGKTTFKDEYIRLLKESTAKKDYDTLSKLAPGSKIGVAGFGG